MRETNVGAERGLHFGVTPGDYHTGTCVHRIVLLILMHEWPVLNSVLVCSIYLVWYKAYEFRVIRLVSGLVFSCLWTSRYIHVP